jgi:hypothetical protein
MNIPERDRCQTPPYGVAPILEHLERAQFPRVKIWEPAMGEGNIINYLGENGFDCAGTDILTGADFFTFEPELPYDCIVTNPPFSVKYKWIERCCELEKKWALLMPLETLGAAKAQRLFQKFGMELILLDKRVNFIMPNNGNKGTAQFPVAWFTHGLNIGREITYATIDRKGER